jgi:hypothetical protein
MQDGASVTFSPAKPEPLQPWHIVLGLIVFLIVAAAIVWRTRKRSGANPGSLYSDRD